MNTLFCCLAAKLRALLWRAAAKNCGWQHNEWSCCCEIKNVIIVQLVYFLSLDIFDFLLFCARLLWLAGVCFIFDFLQVGRNIARRYVAAKYRLHARMADDKNNHRLQVCAKMNCIL